MYINSHSKIEKILGKLPVIQNPSCIFDKLVISFLDDISIAIKKSKLASPYSDLKNFGFWCREANLINISENYPKKNLMLGRGIVLHITPSNVPLNFAFSFAFGMLSGNSNIVRLPSRNFTQVNILCRIIYKILKKFKYSSLLNKFCFVKYDKSDDISSQLSREVDARLIWGGDETINKFKKYQTSPRCVDLTFSNRYSISIMDINEIAKLREKELKNLAQKFYNDCYLMDQQGCSSPQALLWVGKKNFLAKKKFWEALSKIVHLKYGSDLSVANQKITSLSRVAVTSKTNFRLNYKDFKLLRLNINDASSEIEKIQCHFGTFAEIHIGKIDKLKKIISKRFQTITYYGLERKELNDFILHNGITGVDRIVSVGRAFDIGPIWDGYDIIHSLSRIISK
jgi:hypothetical protein|tara:strand:- start:667 stop:1860 length:1194 start_codon:yes stop_codon:yes gene_type:complete